MSERERFEIWVSSPPIEREVHRFSKDPFKSGWPGQYSDITVQLAWEAWCEALRINPYD